MSINSQEQNEAARIEAVGQLATDQLEEEAHGLIDYYQDLLDREGESSWLLGLYMSKQWLKYLKEPKPNIEELNFFVQTLESQRPNQGSGWGDLWSRVRRWVYSIEDRQRD